MSQPGQRPYRVCNARSGNICRSPTAEVVFRAMVAEAGLEQEVETDSAGTGDWHVGQGADARSLTTLTGGGYDGSAHRARQFESGWFDGRDLVIALNRGHQRKLRSLAPDPPARDKVRLLRSFDPSLAGTQAADHGDAAGRERPGGAALFGLPRLEHVLAGSGRWNILLARIRN